MGCKIVDGSADQITDVCQDADGCPRFEPLPADRTIGIKYREYPKSSIRGSLNSLNNAKVNITGAEGQAVMYPSILVGNEDGNATFGGSPGTFSQPVSAANCGKVARAGQQCNSFSDGASAVYDIRCTRPGDKQAQLRASVAACI